MSEDKNIFMDLSNLQPPEPMVKVFETLPKLNNDQTLTIITHHKPFPLYERLQTMGYEFTPEELPDGKCKSIIKRKK